MQDIVVFATLPQAEALRSQLLAASPDLSRMAEELIATLGAYHRNGFKLPLRDGKLVCALQPHIMGIVNCTDDSFYEGSRRSFGEQCIPVSLVDRNLIALPG